MKKILLLNPPNEHKIIRDYYCSFTSKADYYWPPQDLTALSGMLYKNFEIFVIDAIANKSSKNQVLHYINEKQIDCIIFSTGTASLTTDISLIDEIKNLNPEILTVATSGIIKFYPEEFMNKFKGLDAAFLDFTEKEIIDFLSGKEAVWNTIWHKKDGKIVPAKNIFSKTFSYGIPQHELFPYRSYSMPTAKFHPFTIMITSLGCPYKCGFCTAGSYGFKYRDIENVMLELEYIHSLGIKELWFVDPTFTANTRYMNEVLEKMISKNLNFSFVCNADINSMNEEKVKLLKKAGCHTVNVGLESGDNEILKRYNKKLDIIKSKEIINLFNYHKIKVLGYFIIGLPGDTRETIRKTIDFAKSLNLDFASFTIPTPDIGTKLRSEAIEKGWIKNGSDIFDSTFNPIIETGTLSTIEIKKLKNMAELEFYLRPGFIIKTMQSLLSWREFKTVAKNGIQLIFRALKS